MKIEIWSDIVCPFCFIGKHRLEDALKKFTDLQVEIEWKSFQLNPEEITNPKLSHEQHLAESKGWSVDYTRKAHEHVCAMGESCQIDFAFDQVKVVNSLDAHRLMHFAKTQGKQSELKERLFKAYFEEGQNVGDKQVLENIAVECGLDQQAARNVLTGNLFKLDVEKDIAEAWRLGVRGVPFFVFDRKLAVSGAQDVNVFENTIQEIIHS